MSSRIAEQRLHWVTQKGAIRINKERIKSSSNDVNHCMRFKYVGLDDSPIVPSCTESTTLAAEATQSPDGVAEAQ
eukprot:CAMPEP_0115891102 /NCGR_PEP_ID=MMETSP0287-20121206/33690_1 /TAXON_ID=412157 /ORGANISM="Chrysochromulina rotalis, Strain UIO044" /LENGTH=74 /DNA_ID=CAMNT_0003347887 /DNA_START=878 /DNA_END=1101 /DNA_ORIENTATION=+